MAETSQNTRQIVQAPQAGQDLVVKAVPGQDIVLAAAFDQAEAKVDGSNVVFEFANGGQVVLDFSDIGDAQAPNIVMSDGTILSVQEFLASLGEGDVEPAAGPDAGAAGSGGVGSYEDDAGDIIGGVDRLGVLNPRDFSSITVEGLEASDVVPEVPAPPVPPEEVNIPTVLEGEAVTVEDEKMTDGIDEADGGVSFVTGTIADNVDWGLDGFGSVTGFNVGSETFAAGSTVFWGQDGSFLGTSGEGAAASLLVNADGMYTFTLVDNMLLGQDVQGEQIDVLSTVQIIGADTSGDTVAVPVTLSVQDDVPVLLGEGGAGGAGGGQGEETPVYEGIPGPGQGGNALINGLGGPAGFGENVLNANDDGSTGLIDVSSIFPDGMNLFGQTYTGFYINNNGNITFNSAQSTYTPSAITGVTSNPMIAPFFADVDTRGADGNVSPAGTSTGSNLVWWDFDTVNGVITVTWDDVGYYSASSDKVNAFQLRIFDQGDGNFSFEFRYENVDWTTGDASGGTDGLGGTIARAGWTAGDGVNFFELPQSGDQGAILGLETTSNPTTIPDGNWVFNVVGGQIITNDGSDSVLVEDEKMPGGIDENDGGVGSVTGTIVDNVNWGADGFGEATGFSVGAQNFTDGVAVYWSQTGAFLGTTSAGAAASLVVNSNGTYTFTLLDNMLLGQGTDGEQTDVLANVMIVGVDGDGDAVQVPVVLNVQDDVPSIDITGGDTSVTEGMSITNGTWVSDSGADELATVKVVYGDTEYNLGVGIDTGKGVLTVFANGTWTFAAASALDQDVPQNVSFDLKITDSDGDTHTDTYSLSITDDQGPGDAASVALTVQEAEITDTDSASSSFILGSNALASIGFNGNVGAITGDYADEAIVWTLSADKQTLSGTVTGELGATVVLTLNAVDLGTGAYTVNVSMSDEFKHVTGLDNNTFTITGIEVVATDIDGDMAKGLATVTVMDDVPTLAAEAATSGLLLDESDLATNGTADFSGLFTPSYGADGAGTVGNYILGVSAAGVNSGLVDTATGNGVYLFLAVGGVVEGREGTDAGDASTGEIVFTVSVDGSGVVSLDQLRAVMHDDDGGSGVAHDDAAGLAAANLITLTATVTDGDGDTNTATANIGAGISFKDDGPTLSAVAAASGLLVDESDLATNGTADFSGLFTPSYGADGAGTVGNYILGVSAAGVNAGLVDTATGNGVYLFLTVGGVVEGREGTDAGDASTGEIVFTVSVDGSGVVSLDQLRAVMHDDDGGSGVAHDDATGLAAANLITLTATVTDGDGDTNTATANIGSAISFKDDGPTGYDETSATLDDEGLEHGVAGGLGDVPGEATSAEGILAHNFGADGPGSISFASMDGATGTVGVETVTYSWNAESNTLVATGARGALFQVEVLNTETGEYKVTLLDNVLHEAGGTLAVNTGNYESLAGVVTVGVLVPGDPAASLINNGGAFGIQSAVDGGNGGRFNEINYDLQGNPTASEAMVFQLQGERVASSAVVDLTLFFGNETGVGNEVGSYELWLDGVKVQNAVVFEANSGTGTYQLAINGPEGGFDEIRFAALPGTSPTGNDDSDYSIKQVAFDLSYENDAKVALTYTVTDGDGDTDEGTLHLVINDDMPLAVQHIAEGSIPVESFQAGNLEAGWVADPETGLFDPKVDHKFDQDLDGDYQKIDWGGDTVGSSKSSYEFLDNTQLQGTDPLELGLGTFTVGTFVHNNFPINSGTAISTAFLNVSFDITIAGESVTVDHTIKFNHNETPNSPGPGDDIVTIIDGTEEVEVIVDGLKYVLELGFKSGDDIVTEIYTTEGQSTGVPLVAELKLSPDYMDLDGTVDVHYGADGPGSLAWVGVHDGFIDGEYGTLKVDDSGNYEYNLDNDVSVPEGASETFNYTATDADGDSATSTLTIMLEYKGEHG